MWFARTKKSCFSTVGISYPQQITIISLVKFNSYAVETPIRNPLTLYTLTLALQFHKQLQYE